MNILVTGFEPFGGDDINASWEAVRLLESRIGCASVRVCRLPVVFGLAGRELEKEIRAFAPDYVLCHGVAGGRNAITPEARAQNMRRARIPDNAGQVFDGERIDICGPEERRTGLDLERLVREMRKYAPAEISGDAGQYVCNDLYWACLSMQETYHYRGLFTHVPPVSAIPSSQVADAIRAGILALQA